VSLNEPSGRAIHAANVETALHAAGHALDTAQAYGRRTDCLRTAVSALEGALKNVEFEDAEAARAAKGGDQ